MSETVARNLYRQWFKLQASVEQGKMHAANQQRFKHLQTLEAKLDQLDLSPEVRQRIFNEQRNLK